MSCKRKYHYAIRALKRKENDLRNVRMAEAIAQNNSRDLWSELNKMKPREKVVPPNINGLCNVDDICHVFEDKYNKLYNSVPSQAEELIRIKKGNIE